MSKVGGKGKAPVAEAEPTTDKMDKKAKGGKADKKGSVKPKRR